jgi:hypothetical protein
MNPDADCFDNDTCGCFDTSGNTADCTIANNGTCTFTVPGATDLTATKGTASVTLNWTAPVDDFVSGSGYSYTIIQDGVDGATINNTNKIINGLTGGTQYCFQIKATHNQYGDANNNVSGACSSSGYSNQTDCETDSETWTEACATPDEATGDPTWRIQVQAEIDSYDQFQFSGNADWLLYDTQNFLGVALDASYGYDAGHDAPEPPQGPGNYIKLFFDHPEWDVWVTHFTEDIVLEDDNFFSSNLTQWNVRVQSNVPGSTTIRFKTDIGTIPANYELYADLIHPYKIQLLFLLNDEDEYIRHPVQHTIHNLQELYQYQF